MGARHVMEHGLTKPFQELVASLLYQVVLHAVCVHLVGLLERFLDLVSFGLAWLCWRCNCNCDTATFLPCCISLHNLCVPVNTCTVKLAWYSCVSCCQELLCLADADGVWLFVPCRASPPSKALVVWPLLLRSSS